MRVRLAPVLAAISLCVACCGGGGRASDEDQVRTTVTTFARATAAKDYRRICRDVLSSALVRNIQRAGLTCGEVLQAGLQGVANPRVRITSVDVKGDRAVARVRSGATGQAASDDTLRLVRERRGWRISSLGR